MAKSRRKRQPRKGQPVNPVLRPLAWSALLGAVVAAVLASPAYADPPLPDAVPDTGARPQVAGALQLPGAAPSPTPSTPPGFVPSAVTGPLATKILTKEIEVATRAQQLLKLREEVAAAKAAEAAAEAGHRTAAAALAEAQRKAEAAATDALKEAAALPPGAFGSDLHDLGSLARIQKGTENGADTAAAAWEAARTQAAEQATRLAYEAARARSGLLQKQFGELEASYKQSETELTKLKRDNADQLAVIERQREAAEQRIGADIIRNSNVAGKGAHPKAVAALTFALKQRGKPYVWAAEGPDAYDCSGLMWAAYRSVGYTLPRVANDQYYATRGKSVDRSALLPGDLLFFASGPAWQSIHHVGMYVGDGKMVHAPNSNEVVKVSAVWWSRFYAATRVFDAVNAPITAPPAPNPTPTKPKPIPTKPSTPKPIPWVPSKPPTQPPSDEPPPPPADEPPASDTPPADDTPTDAPSASATPSTTASPTASNTASATPSGDASATPTAGQ